MPTKGRPYSYRWSKARTRYLAAHPLCVRCEARGHVAQANVVDHIVPHKGDLKLFWDPNNWQSLCKPCHDGAKQQEERLGYSTEVGTDGWPTDPRHPANAISRGAL
jgi:5-methylcytosine-specific restriction endonuclease McrA